MSHDVRTVSKVTNLRSYLTRLNESNEEKVFVFDEKRGKVVFKDLTQAEADKKVRDKSAMKILPMRALSAYEEDATPLAKKLGAEVIENPDLTRELNDKVLPGGDGIKNEMGKDDLTKLNVIKEDEDEETKVEVIEKDPEEIKVGTIELKSEEPAEPELPPEDKESEVCPNCGSAECDGSCMSEPEEINPGMSKAQTLLNMLNAIMGDSKEAAIECNDKVPECSNKVPECNKMKK